MRLKVRGTLVGVCVVSLALAGCGASNSSSHTYVIKPRGLSGIYVTIVSPVAISTSLLAKTARGRLVDHPTGPQKCSFTKEVPSKAFSPTSPWADLNGKTVTLKVSGSNSDNSNYCSILKNAVFTPALL